MLVYLFAPEPIGWPTVIQSGSNNAGRFDSGADEEQCAIGQSSILLGETLDDITTRFFIEFQFQKLAGLRLFQ
jgi:hypothetical protein